MSTDNGTRSRPRRFSRRKFLALGAVGASALAFGGVAFGQQTGEEEQYKSHTIKVQRERGRQELYVDGNRITTIHTNGVYRAESYMFDPRNDIKSLAKAMVDAHEKLKAKGVKDPGVL